MKSSLAERVNRRIKRIKPGVETIYGSGRINRVLYEHGKTNARETQSGQPYVNTT